MKKSLVAAMLCAIPIAGAAYAKEVTSDGGDTVGVAVSNDGRVFISRPQISKSRARDLALSECNVATNHHCNNDSADWASVNEVVVVAYCESTNGSPPVAFLMKGFSEVDTRGKVRSLLQESAPYRDAACFLNSYAVNNYLK